ncbi:MAG: hypothetical protein IKZ71_03065 [Bacteroidales bacterium]|nr:hypothetical protein [Bacteroidales bacterium]
MKKLFTYFCALLICAQSLSAGEKDFFSRFHPGLEWGYTATCFNYHHFNYLDKSIGFRISDKDWESRYNTNAFVYGTLDFDLFRTVSTSILLGFEGIDRGRQIIPLLGRVSYHPEGLDNDGIFIFLDGGIAIKNRENDKYVNQSQLGAGYSMVLSEGSRLCFKVGFRVAYDRPDVWDPIEEEYVSADNIRCNDAWYCAFKFGVSLSF